MQLTEAYGARSFKLALEIDGIAVKQAMQEPLLYGQSRGVFELSDNADGRICEANLNCAPDSRSLAGSSRHRPSVLFVFVHFNRCPSAAPVHSKHGHEGGQHVRNCDWRLDDL